MTAQAFPFILLLATLFGTSLIGSRFAVGQFHPFTLIGLRCLIATVGYAAIYFFSFKRRRWPRDLGLWRHATVLGIFGTAIPMICFVSGLQYLSSGVGAIMLTTGPAFTVLFAHFFLADEPLTLRKGLGVILALCGTLLIALRGETGLPDVEGANPVGYILMVTALLFASGSNIYSRKYMRNDDAFDVASVRMLVAMLLVLPLAWLVDGIDLSAVTIQGYAALFYAAIAANLLGFFLVFYNIKRFGATAAAMADYLVPVVAGFFGVLLLGEQITAGMLAGMALVFAGIALINRRRRRPQVKLA